MGLDSDKKNEIINCMVNNFFSDKINPRKMMTHLSNALGDSSLLSDAEKLWENRNKEIEERIYQDFRGISSKDIKQILESKRRRFESSMRVVRDVGEISEEDIKNCLPADKLLYNQDIFSNRLRGVDLTSIDVNTEKKLISVLEKESKGLTRQEVILFYTLMKANKLSSNDSQTRSREREEESNLQKALASTFVSLIYPKRITQDDLRHINGGVRMDRNALKDTLLEKIKNYNFSPYAYLLLFGFYKSSDMYNKFINMATVGSQFLGEDVEKVIKYTIFYIVFKGIDDKFLSFANIGDDARKFLHAKSPKPFSPDGAGLVIFLDTFFYALCTQVYDINGNYQRADSTRKIKIYKLYSSEDRLKMIVTNSLSITEKVIQRMNIDHDRLVTFFARYLEKRGEFLRKEDIFSDVFDFSSIRI